MQSPEYSVAPNDPMVQRFLLVHISTHAHMDTRGMLLFLVALFGITKAGIRSGTHHHKTWGLFTEDITIGKPEPV